MKTFTFAILFAALLGITGCTLAPPKPINANGSVSPSVTVGDLDLDYQDAANLATAYVASCHAAPATPGCSEVLIVQLKSASAQANQALHAAHAAIKDFPQGGSTLDKAIADLQAALRFLAVYTAQIPGAKKVTP